MRPLRIRTGSRYEVSDMTLFLVIRLRGNIGVHPDVLETLKRLNMPTKHSAALVEDTPSNAGMLNKVTDYVTWGEITEDSLEALLMKRGRMSGDKKITEDVLKKESLGTPKDLAKATMAGGRVPAWIKETFRLTPPSGGFKRSIKRHVRSGGELGYRGKGINDLVAKMI
jgi:large subunit ribosomal protein L30